MSRSADQTKIFLKRVNQTSDLWRSLDVRVIAASIKGSWHNIVTRIYLDNRNPDGLTRFTDLPVCDELWIKQVVYSFDDLKRIMDQLVEGRLQIKDKEVNYFRKPHRDNGANEVYDLGVTYSDQSRSFPRAYRHWSAHVLSGTGVEWGVLVRETESDPWTVDHEIRTSDAPYDGLKGIIRYFTGRAVSDGYRGGQTSVDVVAPLKARIVRPSTTYDGKYLNIAVRAANRSVIEGSDIGLFALQRGRTLPLSESFGLSDIEQSKKEPGYYGGLDITVEDVYSATIMLRVNGFCVDRMELSYQPLEGGNRRVAVYQVYDSQLEIFREWLFPESKEHGTEFENAVARLFSFCGLVVDKLAGGRRLQDAVDILVHDPSGNWTLACECTNWTLDTGGKLGKLVARTRELDDMAQVGSVRGLIASPLEGEKLDLTTIRRAGDNDIIVLAREELEEILENALAGMSPSELGAFILSQIPRGRDEQEDIY